MNPQSSMLEISETEPRPPGDEEVRILIVDDEPGNRETLEDIFGHMGYSTASAGTGQEALAMVRERSFNVALLDIRLPDMNGTDLLAQIRQVQPQTACIMVTGFASLQSSVQAINSGAYAYIVKPLEIERVHTIIRQALDQQRLRSENARLLRRLQALSEVTDMALSTLDLDDLLRSLLRSLIEALQADAGAILLLDESGQNLEVRASQGLGEGPAANQAVPIGAGFAGRVLLAAGPVAVQDAVLDDRLADSAPRAHGMRSLLGVPLRGMQRTIGMVHVDCREPNGFTQDEFELFDVLATRAALLIDNVRLYEQERRLHQAAEKLALTQQQTAEELRTLYELAQALVENMGLEERLGTMAGQFVKAMRVDRCVIWLNSGASLAPEALLGIDPEQSEIWRGLRLEKGKYGPDLQATLDRGEPRVLTAEVLDRLLPLPLPAAQRPRRVLVLPMVLSRRVIGMAWLDQPGEEREFSPDQLRLGQLIAGQAAVAIENAQTFEHERNVASTLQESMLPRTAIQVPGFEVGRVYAPAFAAAQIGGDYYDFLELPDGKLGVVMGDVCGKGVTAAVFTAMAKYMLRAYASEDPSPVSVITRLNRALYSQMSEDCMFITLVYGVLDIRTGDFTYVNAAHPHPLIYHPGREIVSELNTTGGMVGALPAMEFHEGRTRVEPGAVLLLYTDGVTEARTGHEMLEIQGVQAVLRRAAGASAQTICNLVFRRAREFSGGSLKDDVAIVAIRAKGPAP